MRTRLSVALVVLAIVAGSGAAHAQSPTPQPLMWHEITDWCNDSEYCTPTAYSDLADGSVRVLMADQEAVCNGLCAAMTIPADVHGRAYVITAEGDALSTP